MTSDLVPEQYPVEVSALVRTDRFRHVRIMQSGAKPVWALCRTQEEFEETVGRYRPGTDLADPEQVYWVDHPGVWSGI